MSQSSHHSKRHSKRSSHIHLSRGKRIEKKDLPRVIMICIAGLLVLLTFVFLLRKLEEKRLAVVLPEEEVQTSTTEEDVRWVTVDGVTYRPKSLVKTYLLMGIDETGEVYKHKGYSHGGQADTLMLLVVDKKTNNVQILQLDRDTMTKVPILNRAFKVFGYERWQLCLAHAYGDGLNASCENQALAVSMLLNDQPIDGYLSLNIDAIGVLNDLAGGVTLEVLSDFGEEDTTLVQGETVTLEGEQAVRYVRGRMSVGDGTNTDRMKRQRQYLNALGQQIQQKDSQWFIKVYEAITPYMVTNMGSGRIVELFELLQKQDDLTILTMDGVHEVVEDRMTFEVDADSLQKTVLELFYEPVE